MRGEKCALFWQLASGHYSSTFARQTLEPAPRLTGSVLTAFVRLCHGPFTISVSAGLRVAKDAGC